MKALGIKYEFDFSEAKKIPGRVLQSVCPELDVKKRAKYVAVLRYIRAKKAPGEDVKDFIRKNGRIRGCVTKEKELRKQAERLKARNK
jgi:hypothetical protein